VTLGRPLRRPDLPTMWQAGGTVLPARLLACLEAG
jgi:hypothetical protein